VHVIVWRFRPKGGREREFESAYGSKGAWVALFSEGEGYLGSDLLRSADGEYLTLDRWTSREAYDAFRALKAERYREIDRACEELTESETALGTFDSV